MKKRILLVLIILVLSVAAGCTKKNSTENGNPPKVNPTIAVNQTPKPTPSPIPPEIAKKLKVVQNKDLTLAIEKEKHVIAGQIYVQNGIVVGAVMMDKTATASYAKTIGEKYLKLIKQKYKNTRINIQVVSSSKSLYNIDTK